MMRDPDYFREHEYEQDSVEMSLDYTKNILFSHISFDKDYGIFDEYRNQKERISLKENNLLFIGGDNIQQSITSDNIYSHLITASIAATATFIVATCLLRIKYKDSVYEEI